MPAFSSLEEDGNMLSLPSSRDDARAQPENDERVGLYRIRTVDGSLNQIGEILVGYRRCRRRQADRLRPRHLLLVE